MLTCGAFYSFCWSPDVNTAVMAGYKHSAIFPSLCHMECLHKCLGASAWSRQTTQTAVIDQKSGACSSLDSPHPITDLEDNAPGFLLIGEKLQNMFYKVLSKVPWGVECYFLTVIASA